MTGPVKGAKFALCFFEIQRCIVRQPSAENAFSNTFVHALSACSRYCLTGRVVVVEGLCQPPLKLLASLLASTLVVLQS